MKTKELILNVLICLGGFITVRANADVIVGDAELRDTGGSPSTVMLVTTNLVGGLSVYINDMGGGGYEFSTGVIGSDYRLFSSTLGLEFTPRQAIVWPSLVPGTSEQSFLLNETKYFAYWELNEWGDSSIDPDNTDYYGWVALTHTASGLMISNSATALGGGIIVGTYTQIPEPSSVLLLSMGAGGILFYRRSKQRQQEQWTNRRSFH